MKRSVIVGQGCGNKEKRLQLTGLFRKFSDMMKSRAANGLRHLRRPWIKNPGWVAV